MTTNTKMDDTKKYMTINWQTYVISDPTVLLGKPVVKGTRISVDFVLERLSRGETFDQILEARPRTHLETTKTQRLKEKCLVLVSLYYI